MSINWSEFVSIVRSHKRFLLTSHVRPDCDALGSELGMAHVLEALGKEVVIVNGQATPPNLAFIDPEKRIKTLGTDIKIEELGNIEVLLVLDTSAWAQLGPMGDVLKTTKAKKIILDHHVSEDDLGAVPFKNVQAEATGRLVVEAAEQLGVPLTKAMAIPLFAAIATDTGWFRFGSSTSYTYQCAAKLIDAGAKPADIFRDLYETDTLGRALLRGAILTHIKLELDGRLAHTYVLAEDFARTGAHPSDTEDVINSQLAIAGTQFAVILVEQPTGGFKISFRSRCALDCAKIAGQFGGGGHKAAAGAFVPGAFAEAQAKVLDAVRLAMT